MMRHNVQWCLTLCHYLQSIRMRYCTLSHLASRVFSNVICRFIQLLCGVAQTFPTVVLQFHSRMYDIAVARAKAAAMATHIDRMAASHIEQETPETLVLVEGAVPDADLLTLRQQALDAAPEVRGLLLKILNLPTAQQMVISGALNLHQPTVTPTPSTPSMPFQSTPVFEEANLT